MRQEVAELPGEHPALCLASVSLMEGPVWCALAAACLTLFPSVPRVCLALRETTLCRWSWKGSTNSGDSWKKLLEEAWSV